MSINMTDGSLGSFQPVALLSEFPSTMIPLRNRVEESGYSFFNALQPPAGLEAKIGLIPFNVQLELPEFEALIQAARSTHPGIEIFGVNFGRMRFKANQVYATGVRYLYSLPFEEELLINKLFEIMPPEVDAQDLTIDQLMRVNVLEIESAPLLPFNLYLYLPANRKVLHYYHRASVIDERRVRKFKENAHYSLYIRRTELKEYKRYCAEVVAGKTAAGVAITENQQRKASAEKLMGLMSGFFSDEAIGDDEALMALDNLKGVVEGLETAGTPKELVNEVNKIASQQMTHATHAQNVAAYSCLFGLAVNAGDPTTLKLGGLLHDIGLVDFPVSLIGRDLPEMDAEDAAKYKLHPGNGKIMIGDQKLKVSPGVIDMVLYHHERPDGSGYPYGKKSEEIPLIAKICAFADEFDKLTSVRSNKRQLSPVEAVRRISGLDGEPPLSVYEESVHRPLIDLLLKPRVTALDTEPRSADGSVQSAEAVIPGTQAVKSGHLPITVRALRENQKLGAKKAARLTDPAPEYVSLRKDLDDHWFKLNGDK